MMPLEHRIKLLGAIPRTPAQNASHIADTCVVCGGDIAQQVSMFSASSDRTNIVKRQSRRVSSAVLFPPALWASVRPIFASPWMITSSLLLHVLHVVLLTSKEQMRGIHAWRGVAQVQNVESGWDGSVGQFPRNSMRQRRNGPYAKGSISAFGSVGRPQPAEAVFIDLRPKSVLMRGMVWVSHFVPSPIRLALVRGLGNRNASQTSFSVPQGVLCG
jgi:hypothetical protein